MTISDLQKILKHKADSMVDRNDPDDNDFMDGEQIGATNKAEQNERKC